MGWYLGRPTGAADDRDDDDDGGRAREEQKRGRVVAGPKERTSRVFF